MKESRRPEPLSEAKFDDMDMDNILVGMSGPRPFGVFDRIDDALPVVMKMANCTSDDIRIKAAFNGDILLYVRGYAEARLIKTRLY
jgi:hypothetical protein